MTILAVLALVVGVMVLLSLVSALTDKTVELVGEGIGRAINARGPQGFVAVSDPPAVRARLVDAGVLTTGAEHLTTDGGVLVRLTTGSAGGSQGFACRWDERHPSGDSARVLAEVARTIQAVDPGARIVP